MVNNRKRKRLLTRSGFQKQLCRFSARENQHNALRICGTKRCEMHSSRENLPSEIARCGSQCWRIQAKQAQNQTNDGDRSVTACASSGNIDGPVASCGFSCVLTAGGPIPKRASSSNYGFETATTSRASEFICGQVHVFEKSSH